MRTLGILDGMGVAASYSTRLIRAWALRLRLDTHAYGLADIVCREQVAMDTANAGVKRLSFSRQHDAIGFKEDRTMKREGGFYWVKLRASETWRVAEWHFAFDGWLMLGSDRVFTDLSFVEIDERRIVRPE